MKLGSINDPDFGNLTWDIKSLGWRGHSMMADGTPFELFIHTVSYLTQLPPFVDATWDRAIAPESLGALIRVKRSDSLLRAAVAQRCLPLYSRWNEDEVIDSGRFESRLHLESVTLLPNGGAEIFYNDDGMFAGHTLIAHLDPDGLVRHVEMFG